MKNFVSSLAWPVQVSRLLESIILGFPPKSVLSLDCSFVFVGIFCSYFLNEILKVNGVGSAKLVFQGDSHLLLDFSSLNLFPMLLYTLSAQQGCCAKYVHMPYGRQSARFWWSQSLLCKRQTNAKNLPLFQRVAAGSWSLLFWVFFPLPFCFCCWLTAFSHPRYSFSLRVPLLPCVSLLLSSLKYIHIFRCGWKFDSCAVCSPVYTGCFHTSTAHEAQGC